MINEREAERISSELKAEARRLGFDACGISVAERLDEEARKLEEWLTAGHSATMDWMGRHFDKRVDPTLLVPGARTVISVLHNYYLPVHHPSDPDVGRISRYAWGDDYHQVMKEKLARLFAWLQERAGNVEGRLFVDSAPVLDKAWARRSGVGWIGKHSNLINRKLGSFFFIGELIVDLALPADGPIPDFCGSCTRCIDACPTQAIVEPHVVDARRCISYLTIEHRGDGIPDELTDGMGSWIFGCDICQDVCPWNKFSRPTTEPRYAPRPGVVDTPLEGWLELSPDEFRHLFRHSPIRRAKPEGFRRNVRTALETRRRAGKNEP